MRILVANRGEIALRIMRTIKDLGHESVAIYSRCDKDSQHVKYADIAICVGGNSPLESYLNVNNILSAAIELGVDAIHPGYGFLSENAKFIETLEELGIKFIGPKSESINLMGDKINAIKTMKKAKVPIIKGSEELNDLEQVRDFIKEIGYPVIIKFAGGGGGNGLRVVKDPIDLELAYSAVIAEAKNSDKNPRIFVEQFITDAKHIEVQIISDSFGNVVHLYTRDCSMQRNNQKIIEEAPSLISEQLEKQMLDACVRAVKEINYINAGTFEFLVKEDKFYFLEMNTRLQVEHTISEQITSIDIVKEQINIAFGNKISFSQKDVLKNFHSIECRVNAENPFFNFAPSPGLITKLHLPGGSYVRNDFGFSANDKVQVYYDSLVGKIIVTGENREDAIKKMINALNEFTIEGICTTKEFQLRLLKHNDFRSNVYTTTFIEDNYELLLSEDNNV